MVADGAAEEQLVLLIGHHQGRQGGVADQSFPLSDEQAVPVRVPIEAKGYVRRGILETRFGVELRK